MAKSFRKVIGTDLSQLADLLARHGRGNDSMLAHITPREAKILTDRGGSGTKNPKTGLWEFDDSGSFGGDYSYQPIDTYQAPSSYSSTPATDQLTGFNPSSYTPPAQTDYSTGFNVTNTPSQGGSLDTPGTQFAGTPTGTQASPGVVPAAPGEFPATERLFADSSQSPSLAAAQARTQQPDETPPPPEKKGFLESLTSGGTLAKLGLAALPGALGVIQGKKASAQAGNLQAQQAALGAPYQQTGQALIAGANQGQLTPAGQQALQAARAQAQQGIASRGGVGVAQVANQLAQLKAQLLQQQLDYGLKLAGLGDQIVAGAIKSGWEADRQAQTLQGNYFDAAFKILGALK